MGYYPPGITLFVSPCHFLSRHGRITNPDPVSLPVGRQAYGTGAQCFSAHSQSASHWAKRLSRFFYWLVLRTVPY